MWNPVTELISIAKGVFAPLAASSWRGGPVIRPQRWSRPGRSTSRLSGTVSSLPSKDQHAVVADLVAAEELLDCLEAQGRTDISLTVTGAFGFEVHWR